jgi:ketosteroid isomerase-like protein
MESTSEVVHALYDAYLAGEPAGMLALMSDEVHLRFLGQVEVHGKEAATRFMAFAGGLLHDMQFEIRDIIVDGDTAAAIWDERAVTADGAPWSNHGVDVIHVRDGKVVALHENNDVREVHKHFPPYRANG